MSKLDNQELNNVNGGQSMGVDLVECPQCKKRFDPCYNKVTYGEGCDSETYSKCPDCGHEFKS